VNSRKVYSVETWRWRLTEEMQPNGHGLIAGVNACNTLRARLSHSRYYTQEHGMEQTGRRANVPVFFVDSKRGKHVYQVRAAPQASSTSS
jgi:hypothetical protein